MSRLAWVLGAGILGPIARLGCCGRMKVRHSTLGALRPRLPGLGAGKCTTWQHAWRSLSRPWQSAREHRQDQREVMPSAPLYTEFKPCMLLYNAPYFVFLGAVFLLYWLSSRSRLASLA